MGKKKIHTPKQNTVYNAVSLLARHQLFCKSTDFKEWRIIVPLATFELGAFSARPAQLTAHQAITDSPVLLVSTFANIPEVVAALLGHGK